MFRPGRSMLPLYCCIWWIKVVATTKAFDPGDRCDTQPFPWPWGFLWGCCLQLIRCVTSCSVAGRAARFQSLASDRLLPGCETSVNGSKASIVTRKTRARQQAWWAMLSEEASGGMVGDGAVLGWGGKSCKPTPRKKFYNVLIVILLRIHANH